MQHTTPDLRIPRPDHAYVRVLTAVLALLVGAALLGVVTTLGSL